MTGILAAWSRVGCPDDHLSVRACTGSCERHTFLRGRLTFSDLFEPLTCAFCFPLHEHFLDAGSLYFCLSLSVYNCSLCLSSQMLKKSF